MLLAFVPDHSHPQLCLSRTITYRTDLHDQNAIERVRPSLDALVGKDHWLVDLQDPEHRLMVSGGDKLDPNSVVQTLRMEGHTAIFITDLPSFC